MSNENGWGEYSKLVLKELETLASGIENLKNNLNDVKTEIASIRAREDKVKEIKVWKEKIDEVTSPSQLKDLIEEVQKLKTFKTTAVTVFAVVQFLMAVIVMISKII